MSALLCAVLLSMGGCGNDEFSGDLEFARPDTKKLMQTGSAVALDPQGSFYVVGLSRLDLKHSKGQPDLVLYKYNKAGAMQWGRQVGGFGKTGNIDNPTDIIVSESTGDIYITGFTTAAMLNASNQGGRDAFLLKYDYNGKQLWAKQFGGKGHDVGQALALDALGDVYVAGSSHGMAGQASKGRSDAFLTKFSSDGEQAWTQLVGSSATEHAASLVASDDGLLMTGFTNGHFIASHQGGADAFVVKFDLAGEQLWAQQFGTVESDLAVDAAIGPEGEYYVVGHTSGGLYAQATKGREDAWVRRINADGTPAWNKQVGSAAANIATSIEYDVSSKGVYLVGYSEFMDRSSETLVASFKTNGETHWVKGLEASADKKFDVAFDSAYSAEQKKLYVVGTRGEGNGETLLLSRYQ